MNLRGGAEDWVRTQLVTLVEISSGSSQERAIADYLDGLATSLGLPVHRQEVPGYGPNLLIGSPRPLLVLTAHMDTVVPEWAVPDGPPRARTGGDVVWGLGAQDDKGPLLAALLALLLVREAGVEPTALPVAVGLTVDEEEDGNGSIALAALVGPAHVVALEGTGMQICVAEAGTVNGDVVTTGVARHASMPERGINAIHTAMDIAQQLRALPILSRPHPETLDNAFFVQQISGGSQLSVVPADARMHVTARVGAIGEAAQAHREIAALCQRHGAHFNLIEAVEPIFAGPDAPLTRALADSLRRVLGSEAVLSTMPAWTDAHSFAEAGATAVVFGPGTLATAHRPDEHIDVREVVAAARVLADLVLHCENLPPLP
jgi:acetylornithine deacetylase/succinyl-diaminopimelate desuccinylase-like protein